MRRYFFPGLHSLCFKLLISFFFLLRGARISFLLPDLFLRFVVLCLGINALGLRAVFVFAIFQFPPAEMLIRYLDDILFFAHVLFY